MHKAIVSILVCLSLALGSCGFTSQGDIARKAASEGGAQAMDEGLVNAEWFICNAASVGSVKRRYGKSRTTADAYNELCGLEGDSRIIAGEGNGPGTDQPEPQ